MKKTLPRWTISENDVTPEPIFKQRRDILFKLGISIVTFPLIAAKSNAGMLNFFSSDTHTIPDNRRILTSNNPTLTTPEVSRLTPESKVLGYNNFYEFGATKDEPAKRANNFITDPWKIEIDGLVNKPITLNYEDLFKKFTIEERIYRLRCVEAWSMNIPWLGFQLSDLLKLAQPKSEAKYVAFETLYDPKQMPEQDPSYSRGGVQYPYVEGLRLDEAMNPLTLLSVGLYGKTLAPQNGAPIRLVVPWKYGFKSIKSIVKITLTDHQPPTTWNRLAPREYGFYANVNPVIDHPRWSQSTERFIGQGNVLSSRRQKTLIFNGYQEQVGQLYKNMDLRKYY